MKSNQPKKPGDSQVGEYLTGLQYNTAPVQAHRHNGTDSVRINSNTLAGIAILYGTGVPTMSAPIGTLYINQTPTDDFTRIYINTDGNTAWVYFPTNQHL